MSQIVISFLEKNLSRLKLNSHCVGSKHFPGSQCIRHYQRPRKPFWLPIAKTKMFKIPQKPVIPEDERLELLHLLRVYKTEMKSLRQYFKEQLMAQTTAPEVIEEKKQREAEQHAECMRVNDLWNAEIAKVREKRLAKEAQEREENILKRVIDHEKEQKELLEKIEDNIRREKANLFITPDNIDEAIEVALSTVVDHNFAIDVNENIYKGRYGKPTLEKNRTPPLALTEPKTSDSLEVQN